LKPLSHLGLTPYFQKQIQELGRPTLTVGRVVGEQRNYYEIRTDDDIIRATLSGKMRNEACEQSQLPCVGDFVLVDYNPLYGLGSIAHLLKRFSSLKRKVAGEYTAEQVIASNLDTVMIVNSLNRDLNLRRIERYLVMAFDGMIKPILVLTKKDLVSPEQVQESIKKVREIATDVEIVITSSDDLDSLSSLHCYLDPGQTLALIGSSGVGKSTITNFLLGENIQSTGDIRYTDDKGKHTTTSRKLFELSGGAMILDTPGLREIQLWEGDGGVDSTFGDITHLLSACKYPDCNHLSNEGCAITEAIDSGELDEKRFKNFQKLKREQEYMERKISGKNKKGKKEEWKKRSKECRDRTKFLRKNDL